MQTRNKQYRRNQAAKHSGTTAVVHTKHTSNKAQRSYKQRKAELKATTIYTTY